MNRIHLIALAVMPFSLVVHVSLAAHAALNKIYIEAESAAIVVPKLKKVIPGSNPAYSGKGYIDVQWKTAKVVGSATYKVNITESGKYHVFARTHWKGRWGNSIILVINGQERLLGEDGTYRDWHWVNASSAVKLKKGINTIILKARESGVKIDQIFLTSDHDYYPLGPRPATQDGATGKALK